MVSDHLREGRIMNAEIAEPEMCWLCGNGDVSCASVGARGLQHYSQFLPEFAIASVPYSNAALRPSFSSLNEPPSAVGKSQRMTWQGEVPSVHIDSPPDPSCRVTSPI